MGIISVILGLLAAACGVGATFLFGTAGAIIAGVLAVIAIILGIVKRKKDGKGGIPGIVISVLAIILALSMAGLWSHTFSALHEMAVQYKPDGLWAKATENTTGGLHGIFSQLPKDESSINALMDEMNELNALSDN